MSEEKVAPEAEVQPKAPEVIESTERDNIYAQYEESKNVQENEQEAEASPEEEVTDEIQDEPAEEQEAEASPEEEEVEESEEKSEKEEKTVPYGALKEEREKRKALNGKVDELEDQVKTLIEDNRKFIEQSKSPKEDDALETIEVDEYMDDTTKLLVEQVKKQQAHIDKLESNDAKRSEDDAFAEQNKAIEAEKKRQSDLTTKLEKEGFPGFNMFVPQINEELGKLITEDPDNESLNNEAGYMQIYKDKVFPKVKDMFAQKAKDEKFAAKKELKKKANLGKGVGGDSSNEKEGKDEDWDYNDYIEERKKHSFAA
jgi:hypothetical protein